MKVLSFLSAMITENIAMPLYVSLQLFAASPKRLLGVLVPRKVE